MQRLPPNVFYRPRDIDALVAGAVPLGEYSSKSSALLEAENITLKKGEYLFIFLPSSKSKDLDVARNYISEIRLKPILSFASALLTIEDNDEAVLADTYVYTSIKTFDNKGEECSHENADISYKSNNPQIAEVNPTTGEIYAKRAGSAEITVTIKDDTAEVTATDKITVTDRTAATELPESLSVGFPLGYIELGNTERLSITDERGNILGSGIEYEYEIENEDILTEEDGTFTAHKMGCTDVTVTAKLDNSEVSASFSAAVVGNNLFIRNGVNHGELENGVYLSDKSAGISSTSTMWSASRNTTQNIYTFTHLKNIASELTGRRTSIIKTSVDDTASTNSDSLRVFRIENGKTSSGGGHVGGVDMEQGKIYEFTGFIKLENVKTYPEILIRQEMYRSGTEIEADRLLFYPMQGLSGDQPWTRFSMGATYANWDDAVVSRQKVQARASDVIGYDVLISHLSYHEVSFESVAFAMSGTTEGAKTYDTFATTAVPMSNTGTPIVSGNTAKPITVTYSSSNPVVARVDENGVITAVSDGECEIYASITLGAVTQVGVIPISLSGLEVMFESIEVSCDKQLETGETAETHISYINTDASEYSGDGVVLYYESSAADIAAVDSNGIITAKNPGTATITVHAQKGEYTTKTAFDVTVTDESVLASAYITGAASVEVGFETILSAHAKHISGAIADISQCEVEFSLCDEADEAILKMSKDGTVEGIAEGEANVQVTVSANGASVTSEPFVVEVFPSTPKRKVFDFRIQPVNTSALNATVEKDGWQINRDETSPTRVTEALSGTFNQIRFLAHAIQFRGPTAGDTKEADLAIDILVDYEGWYDITFVGARRQTGGAALLYMNGEYVGECDFSSPDDDSNADFTVELNPMYLKKGLNTFTMREKEVKYLYPACITIDYIGDAPTVTATKLQVSEETLPVGMASDVTVTAELSTGKSYTFGLDHGFLVNEEKKYTLTSSDTSVVEITSDGKLLAVGAGNATITAEVTYGEDVYYPTAEITVTPEGFTEVVLSSESQVMAPDSEGYDITVSALDHLGNSIDMTSATVTFASSDEGVVTVDDNGHMTPVEQGTAAISAIVTIDGVEKTGKLNVSVRHGKVKSTYYTEEKIRAARENIEKYTWANDTKKADVATADKYLDLVDTFYELMPSQGIPRGYAVGFFDDPAANYCRYCGEDIFSYSKYPWLANAISRPWKIQCPDCKRQFPSNDFAKLYELGKDEHGEYNAELARVRNEQLKAETNGETDYLKNVLYPELYNPESSLYNKDPRTGDAIEGTTWGVDDGFGYDTGRVYPNGVPEIHTYISTFVHIALWDAPDSNMTTPVFHEAIESFRDAYLYTGDKKYGRAGAILLDRVADLYPGFDLYEHGYNESLGIVTYQNTGGSGYGKIIGNIWEANNFVEMFATAYDAFFDIYDDPQVISFLSEKARKYSLDDKLVADENGVMSVTGETLRKNVENGILEEALPAVKKMQIAGNFGFKQDTLAKAAVVLDTQPKTQEIIDFIMQPGETDRGVCTGGNVMPQIINIVDRDGVGNESSIGYNQIWAENLLEMAKTLSDYEDVELEDDLLANPKYIKMLQLQLVNKTATRGANIGDAGGALSAGYTFTNDLFIVALDSIDKWDASDEFKEEKRVLFSQILYLNNGNDISNVHYDIFTKNPESLQDKIEEVIDTYGEYNPAQSRLTTGYGFASLSGGRDFTGETLSSNIDNTLRDFFIYFGGGNTSHKHYDGLNLGIDAFGIDMASDLGYPAVTGGRSNHVRTEWIAGTVSHNTVVVNDDRQMKTVYSGDPLHYDDAGEVKVMDIDMPGVYPRYVDTYRRTIVSVDVDDTVSYGIDFFRIIGGDEHVYSFHSRAFEAELDDSITTIKQPMGSYAGANVPYGDVAYSEASESGYNWLENVERAADPGTGTFSVDFDVEKVTKIAVTEQDWYLRMTMLNDFNLSEIALADGYGPQYGSNPESPFRYVLARRSGKNLDTLFTTVLEPYVGNSSIKSLERVNVTRKDGKTVNESDGVAAVKVTLNSGRVDYVVYATDNTAAYRVDDLFDFCGFVGVYTVDGENNHVRSYLLDGTQVGENTSTTASVSGKVTDFTKELAFENFVEIQIENEIPDSAELVGKLINIENDGQQNGAYVITSAEQNGNTLKLGVGDVTFIRSFVDSFDTSKGYYYNIKEGQNAEIALTAYETSAPVFEPVADATATVGGSISIPIRVMSESGKEISLIGTTLPRGMTIDEEKSVLIWKPTASQIGDNHIAITADDGTLTSTLRFTITVYGSTTGSTSGGSGDNGELTTPTTPTAPDNDEEETSTPSTPSTEDIDKTDENARFIDLGNHTWAADSINALADEGIIKGTSENTFSPAANITRADFAILLVRVFELTSDDATNFGDVLSSDYFASELAIARNTGIVNGIGDNKYAPRNTITRQDMMVIVYRALTKLGVELEISDVDYEDFADVAEYAQDAVKALITSGLVNGKSGKIAPTDYTTRAEVAVLLRRILEYVK